MAFNPINFMQAPILRDDRVQSLAENLLKGFNTGFAARQQSEQDRRAQEAFALDQEMRRRQMAAQEQAQEQSADPLYKVKSISEALKSSGLPMDQQKAILNQAIYGSSMSPEQAHAFDLEKARTAKEMTPEQLALLRAQTKYYEEGRKDQQRPVAGVKYQENFMSNLAADNPNLDPSKIREAAGRVADGYSTLEDGTPVKISGITKKALDQWHKTTTTSELLSQDIRGQKAEAELPIITKYIQTGNEVYPTDVMGFSVAKASDTAKASSGDKSAIDRLAKYHAGQVLSFEQSQLQQLLAAGKTTVQATKEIQKHAERRLKEFGVGSGPVKNKTLDYINEATKKAFEERRKIGVGASSSIPKQEEKKQESNKPPEGSQIVKPVKGPDGIWRVP